MLKVCMLVTNEVTPDPRVMKEAITLRDCGCQVAVIGRKTQENSPHREKVSGIEIIRVSQRVFKKSRGFLQIVKTLYRVLMINLKMLKSALQVDTDVYHAHDLDTLPVAVAAGKVRKRRIIYDSHELYTEQRDDFSPALKKAMQAFERFLITKVDTVITVNESIAGELAVRYGIRKPRVLHNFSRFSCIETGLRAEQRAKLGFTEDEIVVLYHGGYQPGRGLEELIASARHTDANIVIVLRGFGPSEERLRRQAEKMGLADKVRFIPPVPMKDLIKEAVFADIGIVSYRPTCLNNYYSLPNKLFEYMTAGLAVISRDLPEIKRLNKKINFGCLFDNDSPEEIARAINLLARDRELLVSCKQRALEWVKSEGNWDKEAEKLKEIYQRCSGG